MTRKRTSQTTTPTVTTGSDASPTPSLDLASPLLRDAAQAFSTDIDKARSALVEDVIPWVMAATQPATTTAATATVEAHDADTTSSTTVANNTSAATGKTRTGRAQSTTSSSTGRVPRRTRKAAQRAAKELRVSQKATAKAMKKDLAAAKKMAAKAQKAEKKQGRRGRSWVLGALALGAVGAAGYYAWKKTQPKDDPWVTATGADFSSSVGTESQVGFGEFSGGTGSAGSGFDASASASADTLPVDHSAAETVVPPRAVDLTSDSDHALGGMAERPIRSSGASGATS